MNVIIKNIFFDLYGVLIGMDESSFIYFLSKKSNQEYHTVKNIIYGDLYRQLERKEVSFDRYLNLLIEHFQITNIDSNKLKNIWFSQNILELPIVTHLQELSKNYSVQIISNTSNKNLEYLKNKFNFFKYIRKTITSENANSYKPKPDIFNYAIKQSSCLPKQSIFVDDYIENVKIADSLGFISHHYEDYDQFIDFMNQFNLKY